MNPTRQFYRRHWRQSFHPGMFKFRKKNGPEWRVWYAAQKFLTLKESEIKP